MGSLHPMLQLKNGRRSIVLFLRIGLVDYWQHGHDGFRNLVCAKVMLAEKSSDCFVVLVCFSFSISILLLSRWIDTDVGDDADDDVVVAKAEEVPYSWLPTTTSLPSHGNCRGVRIFVVLLRHSTKEEGGEDGEYEEEVLLLLTLIFEVSSLSVGFESL